MRVGQDTDIVLTADDHDAERPVLQPSITADTTDQVMTIIGSAAGLPGNESQRPIAEVTNPNLIGNALFQSEAWVDRSDIIGPELLLGSILSSELALRATPWEDVSGDPLGRPERVASWPVDPSANLTLMRWQAGDGVRLAVPTIGLEDVTPRPIMQVTKTCVPEGLVGMDVGFRSRPRGAATELTRIIRQVGGQIRNYQGQIVRRTGNWVNSLNVGPGGYSDYAKILVMPGERIVRAYLELAVMSYATNFYLEVNGTLDTGTTYLDESPQVIDITDRLVAAGGLDGRFFVRIYNASGSTTMFVLDFALSADILR